MRLSGIAAACAAALVLSGCNPTISFDSTVKGTSQIPGSGLGSLSGPLTLTGLNNINLSQQGNFTNNNTDKDHIDHVHVKSMTLVVTAPTPGDLSFLTKLAFTISADGLPTVEIAHQEVFPKGQSTVTMTLDGAELAPYAKAASFSIGATGTGTAPSQNTTIEATMTLTIDAHVL